MIFVIRHAQERCIELFIFIDVTKAFDTINRETLYIIRPLWLYEEICEITRLFHNRMMGQVLHGGDTLDSFAITNGVKQGCVLAPVLFNLFFEYMLSKAVKDSEGVY